MRYIVAWLFLMVVVPASMSSALAQENPFSTGVESSPFSVCSRAPSQYECWQHWENRSGGGRGAG